MLHYSAHNHETNGGALAIVSAGNFCSSLDHLNSPLSYWCIDDNVAVCAHCRLSSHKCHDVVKIEDRNKKELKALEKAIREAAEIADRFKEVCSALETGQMAIKDDYNSAVAEVHD